MRIIAAVAREPGAEFSIEPVELDAPRADEVVVRIMATGVCHTDLLGRDGLMPVQLPAVFGHEGAGIVEQVGGDVTRVAVGDRVAISFRSGGGCARCFAGEPAYCDAMPLLNYIGQRPDGSKAIHDADTAISSNFFGQSSFATHALTYERNLVPLPHDVPFEIAGPLGCGIQTGAGGVMRALACQRGSSILITGAGAVGLSAVMGAVIQGCATIIVVEPHAARRDLAMELGATHTIAPGESGGLAGMVRTIVPTGLNYAFDSTGRSDTLAAALACLAPKGVLGVVGVSPPGTAMPGPMELILVLGLTVRGIIEGDSDPATFIPELIGHWRAGRLPVEKLIRTFALGDLNAAIAAQHSGECVKAVMINR